MLLVGQRQFQSLPSTSASHVVSGLGLGLLWLPHRAGRLSWNGHPPALFPSSSICKKTPEPCQPWLTLLIGAIQDGPRSCDLLFSGPESGGVGGQMEEQMEGNFSPVSPPRSGLSAVSGALGVTTIMSVNSSQLHADSWTTMTVLRLHPRASDSSIWAIHQRTGKQKSHLNQERPKLVVRKAPWRYEHVRGVAGGGEGVCGVM